MKTKYIKNPDPVIGYLIERPPLNTQTGERLWKPKRLAFTEIRKLLLNDYWFTTDQIYECEQDNAKGNPTSSILVEQFVILDEHTPCPDCGMTIDRIEKGIIYHVDPTASPCEL